MSIGDTIAAWIIAIFFFIGLTYSIIKMIDFVIWIHKAGNAYIEWKKYKNESNEGDRTNRE